MLDVTYWNGDTREFQKLRSRSCTADDFKTLAEWCQRCLDLYRKKESDAEAELRDHYARFDASASLHSTRAQILRTQISTYHELADHWGELMSIYRGKAADLDANR